LSGGLPGCLLEASAAISVKKQVMGTRSTKRHAARGRGGTDNISLWREIIAMIEAKGLAVSAALDPPRCVRISYVLGWAGFSVVAALLIPGL
jgi:hypothetical protein